MDSAGVAVIIAAVIGVALLLGDRRETLQVRAPTAPTSMWSTPCPPR